MEEHPYLAARALVAPDLAAVERELELLLASQRDYLTEAELGFYRGGKRLRPLLLVLSAHVAAREPLDELPERAIAAAVSIELSHVGSLIHDDIVDRAPLRRGLPTIAASRGYELALVLGDLQWIQATRKMSAHVRGEADLALMRDFLATGEQTCRGQLDEMLAPRPAGDGGDNGEAERLIERYYRTIDRKTGRLISFACEGGGRLVDGGPAVVGGLRRFGAWLGRAFQIVDDVMDVMRPLEVAGKEPLTDLRQGRLSLPLLYELRELPPEHFLHAVVRGEELSEERLEEGVRLLRRGDGWIRAIGDARAIVVRARSELALLPAGEHRERLDALAAHVVDQGFRDTYETAACAA